eukprot:2678394-Alexandrium_andersonii.AAC.1
MAPEALIRGVRGAVAPPGAGKRSKMLCPEKCGIVRNRATVRCWWFVVGGRLICFDRFGQHWTV